MFKKIAVLGAGAWGTALAQVLAAKGHETCLWTWQESHAQDMRAHRENREFLRGIPLEESLLIESGLKEAVTGRDLICVVVPSNAVRATLMAAKRHLAPGVRFVCASKGIEAGSLQLMSEVVSDVLGKGGDSEPRWTPPCAALSGPSFAKEVAAGVPTNLVAACEDEGFALELQQVFSTERLRVYTSLDPIGVEIGGALKNVIAIAAGACDGLGLGENTRAALMTRGIAEMSRLIVLKGGKAITAAGLAGIGDLVLTCTGDMSRNRTLGRKLGSGVSLEEALKSSDGVAEGYLTSKSAHDLAQKLQADLPICEAVYSVLHGGEDPSLVLKRLLSRPLRGEWE